MPTGTGKRLVLITPCLDQDHATGLSMLYPTTLYCMLPKKVSMFHYILTLLFTW
jgi:hypothetical protein